MEHHQGALIVMLKLPVLIQQRRYTLAS